MGHRRRLSLIGIALAVFKKGGGSSVPIKVTGTARKPEFGLDTGKVLRR